MKLVFANEGDSRFISWHPDGTKFLLECGRDPQDTTYGFNQKICQVAFHNSSVTPTSLIGASPQYSPDGKQIAWVQFSRDKRLLHAALYITDVQFNHTSLLSEYQNWIAEFTWLPGSQQIVYVQRKSNSSCEIYKVDVNDSTPQLLINLDNCYQSLHFLDSPSPNGKYLVFYYQNRAYILDLDSPDKPTLARAQPGARLVWSPDGKLIALSPGNLSVLIDPKSGTPLKDQEETPWLAISRWAASWFNFYFEIFQQP